MTCRLSHLTNCLRTCLVVAAIALVSFFSRDSRAATPPCGYPAGLCTAEALHDLSFHDSETLAPQWQPGCLAQDHRQDLIARMAQNPARLVPVEYEWEALYWNNPAHTTAEALPLKKAQPRPAVSPRQVPEVPPIPLTISETETAKFEVSGLAERASEIVNQRLPCQRSDRQVFAAIPLQDPVAANKEATLQDIEVAGPPLAPAIVNFKAYGHEQFHSYFDLAGCVGMPPRYETETGRGNWCEAAAEEGNVEIEESRRDRASAELKWLRESIWSPAIDQLSHPQELVSRAHTSGYRLLAHMKDSHRRRIAWFQGNSSHGFSQVANLQGLIGR